MRPSRALSPGLFWPGMVVGMVGLWFGGLLGPAELSFSRHWLGEEKLYDLALPAGTHLGLVLWPWLWVLAGVGGVFVLVWGMVMWTRKV